MATLGPYIYQTQTPRNFAIESPVMAGGGLLVEGGVDYNGGIEIGLFYIHQVYYREERSQILAEKVKRMHITLGYRHWFDPSFSAGVSFFSAYSMGNHKIIQREALPSGATTTSAQDATEYGFDASLQWEFWRDKHSAVLVDARYSYSVTKKSDEFGDHVGLLIGYKHSIEAQ